MNGLEQSQTLFELCDAPMATATATVLALWQPVEAPPVFGVSRSVGAPIWRATFPGSRGRAAASLEDGLARLGLSRRALASAAQRLDAFAAEQAASPLFDSSARAVSLLAPEADLAQILHGAQNVGVPFGVGETLAAKRLEAIEQCKGFLAELRRIAGHYAWVETRVEGRIVARTCVRWMGDIDSIWYRDLDAALAALHQGTLALALASRDMMLQTLAIVIRGALTLSALYMMPGGIILALPATWRFVNQVLMEYRQGVERAKLSPRAK